LARVRLDRLLLIEPDAAAHIACRTGLVRLEVDEGVGALCQGKAADLAEREHDSDLIHGIALQKHRKTWGTLSPKFARQASIGRQPGPGIAVGLREICGAGAASALAASASLFSRLSGHARNELDAVLRQEVADQAPHHLGG